MISINKLTATVWTIVLVAEILLLVGQARPQQDLFLRYDFDSYIFMQ